MKRYANIYIINSFSWVKIIIINLSRVKHVKSLYIDIPGHLKEVPCKYTITLA